MFELNYKESEFDLRNALYLAKIADLAYQDEIFIRAELAADFPNFAFEEVHDSSGYDTESVVIGNEHAIIITFRGTETESSADWVSNLDNRMFPALTGYVHQGFWEALDQVWLNVLSKVNLFQDKVQPIWLTGHSQGGALAMLAARRLKEANIPVQGVYTYGQPKVGDMLFASSYNAFLEDNTFRIYNKEDSIVSNPPKLYHAGTGVQLASDGTIQIESGFNLLETGGGSFANLLDSLFDYASDGLKYHTMQAYLARLEKSY